MVPLRASNEHRFIVRVLRAQTPSQLPCYTLFKMCPSLCFFVRK